MQDRKIPEVLNLPRVGKCVLSLALCWHTEDPLQSFHEAGCSLAFDHVFISLWKGLELTELGAELFRKLKSLVYHGLVLATLCYLRSPPQGRV